VHKKSEPAWELAYSLAEEASNLAIEAAVKAEAGEIVSANATVETAFTKLQQSLSAIPTSYQRKNLNFLPEWDPEEAEGY